MKVLIIFLILLSNLCFLYAEDMVLDKYLKAVEKDPGDYEIYNKIGLYYIDKKNHQDARNYFVKAVILNNNYYDGYYNLGLLYYKLNGYNKAIVNFKRAVSIKKGSINLYVIIIHCYLKLNKLTCAKEYYRNVSQEFKKENYKLLNCGGIIELLSKNYKEARELFIKALKIKDDNKIKNNLAISEYYAGNRKKAKKILRSIGSDLNIMKENYKMIK